MPDRTPPAPPSRLEALYSQRAARPLVQFGYDILGVPTAVTAAQVGGVQDNYVLGEGDEIIIDLRGQENTTYRLRVNRDGQIVLPRLNPIPVAGRSFGEFRADLEARVAQSYISTTVFASVGQIRQISVLVAGEVRAPGTRIVSGLATPLDALLLSGGVAKTGSLRNVTLIRGGRTMLLDLYALLMRGAMADVGGLRNGDRIYVPPLRNTVAIAGYVRRPAIYELRDGQAAMGADALIDLAGGLEIASAYRLSKASVQPDGSTRFISLPQSGTIANGEVLLVDPATEVALDRVTLGGAARLTGSYPRGVAPTIGRLIRSSDELSPNAYASFAVIVRRDPRLNVRNLIPVSLVQIFAGGPDVPLQDDDFVYVFSRDEIRLLADVATNSVLRSGTPAVPLVSASEATLLGPTVPSAIYVPPVPLAQQTRPLTPDALTLNPQAPNTQAIGTPPGPAQPLTANALTGTMLNATALGPNVGAPNSLGPITSAPNGLALNGFPQNGLPSNVPPPNALSLAARTPGFAAALAPGAIAPGTATSALDAAAAARGVLPQPVGQGGVSLQSVSPETVAAKLGINTAPLLRLIGDHIIWVLDEVRDPGPYVAAESATLAEMIEVAGGVLRQADLSAVEVSTTEVDAQSGTSRTVRSVYKGNVPDFQRVTLRALDVVRLRPVFGDREDGRVTVEGQVRYPGTFDIIRGEKLSSLLERAGGVTETAYPYGAVFTRERALAAERDGNEREARVISSELSSLASSNNPNDREKIAFLTNLSQEVRAAPVIGRITVTADPAILRIRPELDIILEPGDRLIIPPRPATVTVSGDVLHPGSFQYRPGVNAREYVTQAGGITQDADPSRMFVILPDGSARPLSESWLSFSNANIIPPGAIIVVPRDLRPFDLTTFLRDATQIASQLAITGASLAIIGK